MTARITSQTTFDAEKVIQPIYTGGDVATDHEGRILATCLGEEAVLTDLATGETLARIEGVRQNLAQYKDYGLIYFRTARF